MTNLHYYYLIFKGKQDKYFEQLRKFLSMIMMDTLQVFPKFLGVQTSKKMLINEVTRMGFKS